MASEHQVPALRRRIEQLSERVHAAQGEVSPRLAWSLLRTNRSLESLEERIANGAAVGDLAPDRDKALSAFYWYSETEVEGHLKGLEAAVHDRSIHVPEPEAHQLMRREVVAARDEIEAVAAGPDAKAAESLRGKLAGLELTHVADQARRLELRVEPDGREEGIERAAWWRKPLNTPPAPRKTSIRKFDHRYIIYRGASHAERHGEKNQEIPGIAETCLRWDRLRKRYEVRKSIDGSRCLPKEIRVCLSVGYYLFFL